MKVSKSTIIRAIMLIIALVNVALEMSGRSLLPIDEELVSELVSFGFLAVSAIVGYWKNNSFTPDAIKADTYLKELREGEGVTNE